MSAHAYSASTGNNYFVFRPNPITRPFYRPRHRRGNAITNIINKIRKLLNPEFAPLLGLYSIALGFWTIFG